MLAQNTTERLLLLRTVFASWGLCLQVSLRNIQLRITHWTCLFVEGFFDSLSTSKTEILCSGPAAKMSENINMSFFIFSLCSFLLTRRLEIYIILTSKKKNLGEKKTEDGMQTKKNMGKNSLGCVVSNLSTRTVLLSWWLSCSEETAGCAAVEPWSEDAFELRKGWGSHTSSEAFLWCAPRRLTTVMLLTIHAKLANTAA